jgi:uncharacterized protein (UPF0264 family)
LLVSVRDPDEARAALAGGADIVDAKDPESGALGPLPAPLLRAIRDALPPGIPFTVALGDAPSAAAIAGQLARLRPGEVLFAKVGFAGLRKESEVRSALARAGEAVRFLAPCQLVAVAYADWESAGAPSPAAVVAAAAASGAAGVLLDTARKDSGRLTELVPSGAVAAFTAGASSAGLLVALAGSLTEEDLPAVLAAGAQVIGVRGAACEGGRSAGVTVERVAALRAALDAAMLTRPDRPGASPPRPAVPPERPRDTTPRRGARA